RADRPLAAEGKLRFCGFHPWTKGHVRWVRGPCGQLPTGSGWAYPSAVGWRVGDGFLPWMTEAANSPPQLGEEDMSRKLGRPREPGMIAGVCAGLARRFGVSTGLVRLLFILSLLLPGTQVIVYLALWIIMPNEDRYLAGAAH